MSSLDARSRLRMKLEGEKRRRRRLLWASSAAVAFVLTALAVAGVVSYATSQRPRLSEAVFALPKDASHAPANGKPIYFGDGEAPVTLTLFEDFKCTHCHDLNVRLGSNIESLVESGRLRLAIYPMSYMPGGSEAAANAFACSARYGLQGNSTLDYLRTSARTGRRTSCYNLAIYFQPVQTTEPVSLETRTGGT